MKSKWILSTISGWDNGEYQLLHETLLRKPDVSTMIDMELHCEWYFLHRITALSAMQLIVSKDIDGLKVLPLKEEYDEEKIL